MVGIINLSGKKTLNLKCKFFIINFKKNRCEICNEGLQEHIN